MLRRKKTLTDVIRSNMDKHDTRNPPIVDLLLAMMRMSEQ